MITTTLARFISLSSNKKALRISRNIKALVENQSGRKIKSLIPLEVVNSCLKNLMSFVMRMEFGGNLQPHIHQNRMVWPNENWTVVEISRSSIKTKATGLLFGKSYCTRYLSFEYLSNKSCLEHDTF